MSMEMETVCPVGLESQPVLLPLSRPVGVDTLCWGISVPAALIIVPPAKTLLPVPSVIVAITLVPIVLLADNVRLIAQSAKITQLALPAPKVMS